MSRRCNVPKVQCPEGAMSRRCIVPKVQCPEVETSDGVASEGVIFQRCNFRRCNIPKVYYSEGETAQAKVELLEGVMSEVKTSKLLTSESVTSKDAMWEGVAT